ncbi:charged multivesicular body protein 7-like [Asterias rubens]|uniref:charged multivesicular body protein 7-like n=1 Tax=Asterias rubens TaxID=7604 RepID=UPI001455631A|nr:charged multivesicular body protein 7-like [Asterias rubens]
MAGDSKKTEYFPPCWDDDERMSYLFSDFRQNRTVNPKDWDNKLKFWSQLIEERCKKKRCAVFECDRAAEGLRRKGRLPMGLDRVLREMANNGQIVSIDEFKNSVNASWLSWGVHQFMRRPVSWAVGYMFKGSESKLSGSYILMDVLKEISESILDTHRQCEKMDNLVDYATLRDACQDVCGDEMTFDLVLLYLQKMKKAHVEVIPDGSKVVKFARKNQPNVSPLNETELGVLSLRKTIDSLEKQIEQLHKDMTNLRSEASLSIRKGLKSSAKNILRRKKLIERSLDKKETMLDTLIQLRDQIHGAETNNMTLEAYRAGASALKQTMKTNQLTPEDVDDTMSEVQEVMELCAEIDDAMSHGNKAIDESVSFSAGFDTELLEDELAELLDESTPLENQTQASPKSKVGNSSASGKDFLADFPKVPESDPQSPSKIDEHPTALLTS